MFKFSVFIKSLLSGLGHNSLPTWRWVLVAYDLQWDSEGPLWDDRGDSRGRGGRTVPLGSGGGGCDSTRPPETGLGPFPTVFAVQSFPPCRSFLSGKVEGREDYIT